MSKYTVSIWREIVTEDESYEVEIIVEGTMNPGDPGCRYTPNGDGWPPTDPEVEVESATLADGTPVTLTAEELVKLDDKVADYFEDQASRYADYANED